jgi:transposase InsO family protein
MTHKELIEFVQGHIIHRFRIPQTLTTNQGLSFMSHQFREFAESFKLKLMNSSPYYAQATGQAESRNRTLIRLVKKNIENYPRRWHEVLSEALWAHRTSQHGATKVTLFKLVYGQEAILPVEINLQTCSVAKQGDLSAEEYTEVMMERIDSVLESWFKALCEIEQEKGKWQKLITKGQEEGIPDRWVGMENYTTDRESEW